MEAKTKLVKDLITGLDLNREEALELIVFIMTQSGISFFDFSKFGADVTVIHDLLAKQNGLLQGLEKKLTALEEKTTEKTTEKEDKRKQKQKEPSAVTIYPKGYSANGKKLGRPRKEKAADKGKVSVSAVEQPENEDARKVGSEPVQNPPAVVAEDVQAPVLEKAEQQKPRENVFKAASSREKRQSSMPLTKAEAASLEMGKVLPLKLVYKTGEGLYLSERILNSLNPEGVVVPYRINGKFFLLRIFDEVSAMSVQEAVAVAKKRERINGKPWMLLTPQQKESCKAVQTELNEVIKKIGGDLFDGQYLTNPPSYGNKSGQKIRFTVEL